MNADAEFLKLAREMREAQKAYFNKRTRSAETLDQATKLEREFDYVIREIMQQQQPQLFGEDA